MPARCPASVRAAAPAACAQAIRPHRTVCRDTRQPQFDQIAHFLSLQHADDQRLGVLLDALADGKGFKYEPLYMDISNLHLFVALVECVARRTSQPPRNGQKESTNGFHWEWTPSPPPFFEPPFEILTSNDQEGLTVDPKDAP